MFFGFSVGDCRTPLRYVRNDKIVKIMDDGFVVIALC